MSKISIARPYAEAIFNIALEKKDLMGIEQLLVNLDKITQDKETIKIINIPSFTKEKQLKFFTSLTTAKKKIYKNILSTLIFRDRIKFISEIYQAYKELCDKHNNEQEIAISSAHILSKEQQSKLIENIENDIKKAVKPIFKIEENLIGGIKIKINDVVIDKSVLGLVDQLREALINYEDRNYAAT
ncbi:MAG: F0F1 ATP synthase subunit delta [Pseudomonadota bacterium]|nr:F0F1 ATP synthase subunit delta [Pseudomonadota bacterium]